MTVGERIKNKRIELDMSQGELAKKMGVSRQAVSKAELHDNNITTEKVRKFAKALGVTDAYLLGWENNEPEAVINDFINGKLTGEEEELIKVFRELDDEAKRQLVLMMAFLKSQK